MPHVVLEHSNNIQDKEHFNNLFAKLHVLLADGLPTDISTCKSRAMGYDDFYSAAGQPNQAFVHVTLKVMSGRTPDKLREVGNRVMALLQDYFSKSTSSPQAHISLEIVELAETYFK